MLCLLKKPETYINLALLKQVKHVVIFNGINIICCLADMFLNNF